MISGKTKGTDKLLRKTVDYSKYRSALAGVRTSGGGARSAVDNLIILRTQAKRGRDVIFLSTGEAAEGRKTWLAAIKKATAGSGMAALDDAAKRLGTFMSKTIQKHISRSMGEHGSIKPVTESTQRRKDRKYGTGLPPLIRSGALMRSLVGMWRRL